MKYYVHLNEKQRKEPRKLIRVGKAPPRTLTHARILLKADKNGDGLKDQAIRYSPTTGVLDTSLSAVISTFGWT